MSYQAYLFDLDGTLLDSAKTFALILNQMRNEKNLIPLDFNTIRAATANGANAMIKVSFNIDEKSAEFELLKQQFLNSYRNYITSNAPELFEGIENILQYLNQHKIPWGIITNKHEEFTHLILKTHPLLASAHSVVCGDTVPHGKPHPDPLLHASDKMHVIPKNIIFIGDHPYDIKAGHNAGMATGVAMYGYIDPNEAPKNWNADYYFASPAEIYQWLKIVYK